VLLALVATGALAASARAATYKVGTLEDLTGTCQEPASGTCSLRQLITYENNLLEPPNPPDTIDVPAPEGVAYYDLANGPLTIFKSVSIVGAGARVVTIFQESSPANRVFFVEPNPRSKVVPTVTISGLSMAFGHADEGNGYFGGDIRNEATLTLSEDDITNGTAESGSGGGISNDGGTLTVTHSLVANNLSTDPDGGGDSGGIQNFGPNPVTDTAGKLTVTDSTIAGNSAALGGGIFSWCGDEEGACSSNGASNTTTITNSTIANNDGGARSGEGGGLLASEGTISVENSIVADNTVEDPLTEEFVPSNCGDSNISSLGHNLQSGADCAFVDTGDLKNTEPGFLSSGLQDNGGNTDTLALEAGSPAVDAIPSGAPGCSATDQRNIARPQGTGCDIGAYELLQPIEGQQFSEVVGRASPREGTTPTINWGDGTAPSSGKLETITGQLTGTHTYVNEGIYHASFTYTNSDGFPETRPFDVKVQDAPLTAVTGVPVSATPAVAVKAKVATFTHTNPAGVASDYTATITWGDGTASTTGTVSAAAGGGFEVTGSHTYAAAGTYTTSVTINDIGGAKATATSSANVVGPPIVTNEKVLSVTETTAKIGVTINPNGADTTYTIEYGPTTSYGQKTTPVKIGATPGPQALTQTLTGLQPGKTYHFKALAINSVEPKGVGGGDKSFTTESDAPLSATGKSVSGTAGVKLNATVATFTDADPNGVASEYTASINWGDGSSSTAGTVSAAAGGGFEVKGSHTYAAAGRYTTSVAISDVGGAKATATGGANVVGPPVLSNVNVISVTETTATVGFEIDPDGADTTYVIEYGPTTSYGQQTTPVDIGATPGPQSLTRTLTGLEPNRVYHFNVLATNSAVPGGVGGGDQPFTTGQPSPSVVPPAPFTKHPPASAEPKSGVLGFQATQAPLPPPVLGKTVNVTPVSGIVYVELPPGATLASRSTASLATASLAMASLSTASLSPFSPLGFGARAFDALAKGRAFVPLTQARQIPVGSILETTRGVVGITTATTASPKGKLQSGDFGAGIFKLLQNRKQKGLTDLDIVDNHSASQVCATVGKRGKALAAKLSSKTLGRVNASGHGHFAVRGQYSAATVRGTVWNVSNRCEGTFTHVTRGVVSVRDFRRRKTITLFTGESYLARGPVKRG
jgi:fibronectin type III domain protein